MREKKCKGCGKTLPWFAQGKECAVCAVDRMRDAKP